MRTKLIRVDKSLAEELEREARNNQMSITRWSQEIAKILKNRKIKMEIKF